MLCVLALLTLGVIMVNSAGMSVDPSEAVTVSSILLSRSTVYMALAIVAMGACAMLPIRRVLPASWLVSASEPFPAEGPDGLLVSGTFAKRFTWTILGLWPMWTLVALLLAVLATVYIPGISRTVNGSSRWISLPAPGLESIQPSEFAKWAMVVILAWYGAASMHRMHRFWRGLLPGLIAAGALAGFIVIEDLGTGVLLGCVACVMLIAAGARIWQLAVLAPAPLTLVALAISTSQYRRERLLAFLDPYADPDGIGYHMIQSMVAVANGEVAGRGLGHGLQKFGYLPEDRTDFLFAIICEELGVAGAMVVVALYAGLLWGCWSVIRREQAVMLKLLGLGVVATVGIQALINLAVVTGLGPTKGIALPLLSSGGTGWILTAASLGLIVAMDRTQDGWTAPHRPVAEPVEEEVETVEAAIEEPRPEQQPEDDHSRWAPPTLFTSAVIAADAQPLSVDPGTPVEPVTGEQGMLFAGGEQAIDTPADDASETFAVGVLVGTAENVANSLVDAADEPELDASDVGEAVVDAGSDASALQPVIEEQSEELVSIEGATEPLIVTMDEPAAADPGITIVAPEVATDSSIGRHV